jgi:uncharacterized protein (TIGR00266 family)
MAKQWYMAVGGHQIGPVSEDEILTNLANGSIAEQTLLFGPGMSEWKPLKDVPQFANAAAQRHAPQTRVPSLPGRRAHEIDLEIHGEDLQFVEVTLDPGETAIAEAGSMMYMTQSIQMETRFGDGSQGDKRPGVMDALLGAGKRLLTGESLFMTFFTNAGSQRERVAFAAPYPGRILSLDLHSLGGELICQKDSFLCAARGVSIGIAFQKRIGVGLFGGEGFIMQRLRGDGVVCVHAGGMLHSLELKPGELLKVDTGCIVAMQNTVDYDIQFVGGIKNTLFGGEGLFFATLRGPGKVWLQSLPLSRLADRITKAAPGGGSRREEGSILGGLGNLLDGDS